jgi:hypothetical protein
VVIEAQEKFFNMEGKPNSINYYREVKEDDGLQIALGSSNKVAINDLAEGNFSSVIRVEASLQ